MRVPAEHDEPERGSRSSARPERDDADRAEVPVAPAPQVREAREARELSPAAARQLQRSAGNRVVARMVAGSRRAGSTAVKPAPAKSAAAKGGPAKGAPPPTATAKSDATPVPAESAEVQRLVEGRSPGSDPKFAALKGEMRGRQKLLTAHRPPQAEAANAQGAAKPPQDDKEAQGKAANAEKMNAAKPGEFDKAAFIRAVNDAIAAQAPKNLDEADRFGDSGKAGAVKDKVAGQVTAGKKASAGAIEATTKAPPDTSKARDKPVVPLSQDAAPGQPPAPDPAKAVPDKAPPAATDFSDGPKQVDDQMAQAEVTEDQLARSNEPEFTGALKSKKEGEAHAAAAPAQVRGQEAQTLNAAKASAGQAGAAAMAAMTADRQRAGAAVTSGKAATQGSDEAKRAQVTGVLQKVFDATKKDVEDILAGLDKKVDDAFNAGEQAARSAFTAEHKRKMDEYKDKRYSGFTGKARWLKDKFTGLPEEANQIFVTARQGYQARMQQVISQVADIIGAELGRAKQRIATGRHQLQAEVAKLPKELQALGKQAAGDFAGKFDELTETVDAKGKDLVQSLAAKYQEALGKVDDEIAAEKAKNTGLISKAMDAVGGVIKTILELKNMLLGVLAKAASAVMAIIKDPIGFLGKLVHAVGAGIKAFMANIGEHLKKGLIGWLTGAMAGAGLQLPAKFDLRGIFTMIASLLGLTWGAIRGRIVAKGVPEQAMGAVEQSVPVVQKVQAEGVGGIWEEVKEKFADLKDNLFAKISEYLIPTILIAGVTWIVSLLNPASAFIKACKMIIDFVTFIIERGAQIIAFVNSVLDAVIAIAGGGGGGVPQLIEKALAASVPVLIGVLAALLGIGGVADKVKKIFQSLSKPIMKAVDWVVDKIVKLGKKIWAKLKSKLKRSQDTSGPDTRTESQKIRDLNAGLDAAERLAKSGKPEATIRAALPDIVSSHRMTALTLTVESGLDGKKLYKFAGEVNPRDERVIPRLDLTGYKARKVSGGFTGMFNNFPSEAKAQHSGFTLTPHPANERFRHPNGSAPFPGGQYTVTNKTTPGNQNTDTWRTPMNARREEIKRDLQQKHPEWSDDDREKAAKTKTAQEINAAFGNKYNLPWQDLYLVGWSEHHIHPANWGGHETSNQNLVYLKDHEHQRFSTYFEDRKRDIEKELG